MTYLEFLAIFLAPPIILLGALVRRQLTRPVQLALGVIILLALVYTTPWDDQLIAAGVWTYPPGRVLGLRAGRVPIEEICFYVLQVVLTSLVALAVLRRDGARQ